VSEDLKCIESEPPLQVTEVETAPSNMESTFLMQYSSASPYLNSHA